MSDHGSNSMNTPPRSLKGAARVGIVLAVLALAAVGWGIFSRIEAQASLAQEAQEQAAPTVNVLKVQKATADEDLVLPGNVQAWADAPIYARSNGYLKRWLVDIGTPVKAGQLLAEVDIPDVDQQLAQSEADLASAEAGNQLAKSTAARWKGLLATDSVSKQEADEKIGDASGKRALAAAARANVSRLRQLQQFRNLVAPFDGVVTARNVDVGDLIGTGGNTQRELFHVADVHKLRIYVQVPQSNAQMVQAGMTAELRFDDHPGKTYPASVARTANAINPAARTLLVELEADNASGELLAGSYTEVHFKLPARADAVYLPANALLFREDGMKVASVGSDNRVALRSIKIGRDLGDRVEVLSGIAAGESVVLNPPDSLVADTLVRVLAEAPKAPAKDGAAK